VAASDEPLVVRPGVVIPAAELDERFSPSGGPGGQHANRAHTRVELRVDLVACSAFTDHQRARLVERFGDDVRVVVDEERSQLRNRSIARDRMAARLRAALTPQRTRTATRPTKGSRQRRLEGKRQRSQVKRDRRRPSADD
jgi:ribosome-associated protein